MSPRVENAMFAFGGWGQPPSRSRSNLGGVCCSLGFGERLEYPRGGGGGVVFFGEGVGDGGAVFPGDF